MTNEQKKQFKDDMNDLDYHFRGRYPEGGMLAVLLYGCEIRTPDHTNDFHRHIHDLELASSYYRAMVDYGTAFILTDPDHPNDKMLGFIQKWVYDQL